MLTVQPKSSSRPEDMCLGRMLKGAEVSRELQLGPDNMVIPYRARTLADSLSLDEQAKSGQPFTRTKVEEILAGDLKGLVNYILKDTRKACSVCGTAVFDEGKKIAIRNGYTMGDLDSIEKTIDKKCPAREYFPSFFSLDYLQPLRKTNSNVYRNDSV